MAKISIITINYNKRAGLRRTLASLRGQTHREFELVVVDAASTDGSLDELPAFSDIVTDVVCERDEGIHDGWNKGIARASGDLIALLNSGDAYHPEFVETMRTAAESYNSDRPRVFCGNTVTVVDGTILKAYGNRLRRVLWAGIGVVHPAMFMTRSVYERVGSYRPIPIACDTDFVLRCIRAGVEFVPVDALAYMEADGVSARNAKKAFSQYCQALVEHGFCKPLFGRALSVSYSLYRTLSLRGG